MLTEKTITIPIYEYKLKIVVFDDINDVRDKYPNLDIGVGCDGLLIDYGDKSMMCIPANNLSVVIHECEHAKNAIWLRIGHKPTADNDEVDAYLLEYIWEQSDKVIKKHLDKLIKNK